MGTTSAALECSLIMSAGSAHQASSRCTCGQPVAEPEALLWYTVPRELIVPLVDNLQTNRWLVSESRLPRTTTVFWTSVTIYNMWQETTAQYTRP
jgi:hypothetical protein